MYAIHNIHTNQLFKTLIFDARSNSNPPHKLYEESLLLILIERFKSLSPSVHLQGSVLYIF